MQVTLQQIKDVGPCQEGWHKVLKANGGTSADLNKSFKVSSILESNDLADTLWVLGEVLNKKDLLVKFTCNCALQNVELIKPYCLKEQYKLITNYLNNPDNNNTVSVRTAVTDATINIAYSPGIRECWASTNAAMDAVNTAYFTAWYADIAAKSAVKAAGCAAAKKAEEKRQVAFLRTLLNN